MAIHLTDKVTMSKTWDAYINTTVLCGQEGFVVWAEDGDLGHCFQDLVLHIPAQVIYLILKRFELSTSDEIYAMPKFSQYSFRFDEM